MPRFSFVRSSLALFASIMLTGIIFQQSAAVPVTQGSVPAASAGGRA